MSLDIDLMKTKINAEKMRSLADTLKNEIPNCGFALIVFQPDGDNMANYISNVNDDFMIKALEVQLDALKKNRTFPTPESKH
jgi:flagellar motor switch protein FliG